MDNFFKTIRIGGVSTADLLTRLSENEIQFNEYAKILFADARFTPPKTERSVDLVKTDLRTLGFDAPTRFDKIASRAELNGLSTCPLYLAAFLRLAFLDQAEGPYLTVAPETGSQDSYPDGYYLRIQEGSIWLRGYRTTSDYRWPVDSEFVFVSKNRSD